MDDARSRARCQNSPLELLGCEGGSELRHEETHRLCVSILLRGTLLAVEHVSLLQSVQLCLLQPDCVVR